MNVEVTTAWMALYLDHFHRRSKLPTLDSKSFNFHWEKWKCMKTYAKNSSTMGTNSEASIAEVFLEVAEQGHLVHDMKSPFNGIVGLTEPMAKLAKEPEKKKQLTWVNVCGARWCKYIESTVDSNLLATGTVDIRSDSFNLGFMVEEACAIMSVAKDPREKPIKNPNVIITNTVPLEGLTIVGSDPQTSKCIYHLLTNAIKFTDTGTITISHRIESDTFVVITIMDTGCGIPGDQLDRIFLPFVKLRNDVLPGESLGLGLSSTKEYIEFVGGKITIQSCIGKGTTAELWIPKTASNIGQHNRGPFGFAHTAGSLPGPWLLQKRALGILAHDLLPAHWGIAGMAEVLINNEPKAPAKKQLGMILRSGNRVVEVLSLIRDSTLVSEPGVVPRSIPIRIGDICSTVFDELNKALDKRGQPMKKKTVEFVNEVSDGDLAKPVNSDPFYVYRVIYQLCDNALKFTAEGTVVVSVSFTDDSDICFQVSDSGCGFDKDVKLAEIFKPFHRLEPETYYGIGLGLNMVHDIEQKICARIQFDSQKGKGTVVKFTLPMNGVVGGDSTAPVLVTTPSPDLKDPKSELPPLTIQPMVPDIPVTSVVEPAPRPLDERPAPTVPSPETPSLSEQAPQSSLEPKKEVQFDIPGDVKTPITEAPVVPPESPTEQPADNQQFTYADMPKDDEPAEEFLKRKTLAGDKYRLLVEMDDGTEQPSHMSAMGHLNLAIEVLKERIAVAQSMSNNIKTLIKKFEETPRY
jgi:signal transduction histidine kinase